MPAAGPFLNVVASLQIAPPGVILENLTGQGLRIDWQIEKCIGPSPNTCDLVIYNLNLAQREALAVASAAPIPLIVSLQIGWAGLAPAGIPEIVFIGQVWEIEATKKENTNVLTLIKIGDGAKPLADTPPNGGTLIGITFAAMVNVLAAELGLPVSPAATTKIAEKAAALPVPTFQFTGDESPRDYLNVVLASLGLSWGVEDCILVVYQGGLLPTPPGFLPPLLAPFSGLLSFRELDDGSLNFEALAIPAVKPGALVLFQDFDFTTGITKTIGGAPMRIERVQFTGSTMGPSIMTGLARRLQLF